MRYEQLTLLELRDLFWEVKLLHNMPIKRAKAYSHALDPLMHEFGQYRVEWLSVSDFMQIIEESLASSNHYPLRRMGAMRYFFSFLHELGLLDADELATLCSASYLTPQSTLKGGEKMAKLKYYPDEMGSLLRDKFTTDTHAPPALQLEYDESKYTDVDSAEVKKIVLEHAVDRLREELEQQPVEDAYAHQLVTWRLFVLMRDLEMFDFDYHLKWSLWLTLNGHMKFKWSDFCTTQLQHFNADTALQWMLAATQGFYAEAKTSRYKMYFSNRKASELYWSMVVFFDMACRLELIQQNPCRIPQAIESHFSRNGKHLIWQNPTQFAW